MCSYSFENTEKIVYFKKSSLHQRWSQFQKPLWGSSLNVNALLLLKSQLLPWGYLREPKSGRGMGLSWSGPFECHPSRKIILQLLFWSWACLSENRKGYFLIKYPFSQLTQVTDFFRGKKKCIFFSFGCTQPNCFVHEERKGSSKNRNAVRTS